jgi:hypothetical protein
VPWRAGSAYPSRRRSSIGWKRLTGLIQQFHDELLALHRRKFGGGRKGLLNAVGCHGRKMGPAAAIADQGARRIGKPGP